MSKASEKIDALEQIAESSKLRKGHLIILIGEAFEIYTAPSWWDNKVEIIKALRKIESGNVTNDDIFKWRSSPMQGRFFSTDPIKTDFKTVLKNNGY